MAQIHSIELNLRSNPVQDEDVRAMLEEIKTLDDLKQLGLNLQQTKVRDARSLKGVLKEKVDLKIV